jgi:hypothetical protein
MEINHSRRKLLKLALFGGATFFAGKLFGGWFEQLKDDKKRESFFEGFTVVESKKELGIFEKNGDQILVIDKEVF